MGTKCMCNMFKHWYIIVKLSATCSEHHKLWSDCTHPKTSKHTLSHSSSNAHLVLWLTQKHTSCHIHPLTNLCTHSLSHFQCWHLISPKYKLPETLAAWSEIDVRFFLIGKADGFWRVSPQWLFCVVQLHSISWLAAIQRSEVILSVSSLLGNLPFLAARLFLHIKSHLTHLEHWSSLIHILFPSRFFNTAALFRVANWYIY